MRLFIVCLTLMLSLEASATNFSFKDLNEGGRVSFHGSGCDFFKGNPGNESDDYSRFDAEIAVGNQIKGSNGSMSATLTADIEPSPTGEDAFPVFIDYGVDRQKDSDKIVVKQCEFRFRFEAAGPKVDGRVPRFEISGVKGLQLPIHITRAGTGSNARAIVPAYILSIRAFGENKRAAVFSSVKDPEELKKLEKRQKVDPDGSVKVKKPGDTKISEAAYVTYNFTLQPTFTTKCVNTADIVVSFRVMLLGPEGKVDEDGTKEEDENLPNTYTFVTGFPDGGITFFFKPC